MSGPVAHRKIELQTPEDLTYLLTNVRRAAKERLDEAFPPVAAGADDDEDDLRVQIETMVTEYIDKTFTLAAPNISINGLPINITSFLSGEGDIPVSQPQYEPFDERAHATVLALAREEEDLLAEIAALKMKVPSLLAAQVVERGKEGLKEDEEEYERLLREAKETAEMEARKEVERAVQGVLGEREGVLERNYGEARGALERVAKSLPATLAKMERAKMAGEYVVAEGR